MGIDTSDQSNTTPGAPGIARKVVVGSVGGTVTAVGIVMLVTPGPGVLISLAGLSILAREFPGARRRLDRIRTLAGRSDRPPS